MTDPNCPMCGGTGLHSEAYGGFPPEGWVPKMVPCGCRYVTAKNVSTAQQATGHHHLDTCGLDNIYLVNGFRRITHNGLQTVVIDDEPELYQAIGEYICRKAFLSGKEFAFLREAMRMPQKRLGIILGVTANMVSLWERGNKIPKLTLAVMKALYLDYIGVEYNTFQLLMADETPRPANVYFGVTDSFTWGQVKT